MLKFTYDQPSTRVVFGTDAIRSLPEELIRLGVRRALVVATPSGRSDADRALEKLGSTAVDTFVESAGHMAMDTVKRAHSAATRARADGIVAIGGGSAIGIAKGVALWRQVPIVALPTTYSGSEATPIYGFTDSGLKTIGRDPAVLPKTVLYDPSLATALPPRVTATSGMNALAHCVVGLWAEDAHPVSNLFAGEGIRVLSRCLPKLVGHPDDLALRSEAFYGSWLAGSMLAKVSVSMH